MTTQIKGNATSTFGGNIDVTGNVVTDAPVFSVGRNTSSGNQSISSNVWTKVEFTDEDFDTNSNYDNATNYRFTPTIAGYYQINTTLRCNGTSMTKAGVAVYKNGTFVTYSFSEHTSISATTVPSCSALVYCNGTTDYIECYGFITASSSAVFAASDTAMSKFSGHLARAV